MQTVLGIDLGTQSLKTIFYDIESRAIVASASSPLELNQDNQGTAEQEAQWWLDAMAKSLTQIEPNIRKTAIAIGVSGQQHGFVPLDIDGNVLAPVKLWCDTSTQEECDEMTAQVGGEQACLDNIGNLFLTGYTAPKIRWLKKNRPDAYQQMHHILLPHDYLNYVLTGELCMEHGDASGTGLLNINTREWSAEAINAIDSERDLTNCLPVLKDSHEIIGTIKPGIAKQFGLPSDLKVSTGGGDNMMGAIGTGNVTPGKVTMSLGTSGTLYAYSDQPIIDPEGNIAAFCSSTGGWLPLLCTMNCTVSTEITRALFDSSLEDFEQQISKANAGSDGVITLPFFNGERTPNLPDAKGCVIGLTSSNSRPENYLRSAAEGAIFALRFGLDALAALGIDTNEIIITGGGTHSPTWRQIIADICNTKVTVLEQTEGAALGAALQALWAYKKQTNSDISLESIVKQHLSVDHQRCCVPDSLTAERYNNIYQQYQEALKAITQLYRS